jgi:hypothetical protein
VVKYVQMPCSAEAVKRVKMYRGRTAGAVGKDAVRVDGTENCKHN